MARARNIKPGVFKNEILSEQTMFVRLLFIGLWTLADREGRIEDRPKRIKAELFPYDNDDADAGLNALVESGFIIRYQADGKNVIQIINFLKHQTPHGTEKDSELPDQNGEYTAHERTANGYVTGNKRANNVKPQEVNSDAPRQKHPDLLNPDSLNPEVNPLVTGKPVPCPQQEILSLFSEQLSALPQPRVWDGVRAKNLQARWRWVLDDLKRRGKPCESIDGLAFFRRMFSYIGESDFLMGRSGGWQGCNLGWIVKAENFAKIIEGHYENKEVA